MLYEVTFPNGRKTEYVYLDIVETACREKLVEEYNTPFMITPSESKLPTEYFFCVNEDWFGMYFVRSHIRNTVSPFFFWETPVELRDYGDKEIMSQFEALFGSLPEDLDPYYAPDKN